MKTFRNSPLYFARFFSLAIALNFILMSGCSSIGNLSERKGINSEGSGAGSDTMVSKEMYDQLLARYKELVRSTQDAANYRPPQGLGVTVDEGEEAGAKQEAYLRPKGNFSSTGNEDELIQREIDRLQKARGLLAKKNFEDSLALLRELENSSVDQVRVRAKFYLGELFFEREEYDLAMQIYEGILRDEAFSSVVVDALGRLIICCQKLGLQEKEKRYYSLLNDFFLKG